MNEKDDRAARLARQLRENLRRRKGRAREEQAAGGVPEDAGRGDSPTG